MRKPLIFVYLSLFLSACGSVGDNQAASDVELRHKFRSVSDAEIKEMIAVEMKDNCLANIQKEHLPNNMTAEWLCDCSNIYIMEQMDIETVRKIVTESESMTEQERTDFVESNNLLRTISLSMCMSDFHDKRKPGWD